MSSIKQTLTRHGIKNVQAAKECAMSPTAFSLAINRDIWPATNGDACRERVRAYVAKLAKQKVLSSHAADTQTKKEEPFMVVRKQTLLPKTRRVFSIYGEPFGDDLGGQDGVFLSDGYRYVRESMLYAAKHGGFMAVIGESGSGKTVLKDDLAARIRKEGLNIVLAEPYVLGMEDNDKAGKTLKAYHIAEAIIHALNPKATIQSSPEALFRQTHEALISASDADIMVTLIIDEAHKLPRTTIKHLKRFNELKNGFKKVLSIILMGQTELDTILWEGNSDLREVIQRIEKVYMPPIDDLQGYITHRLALCGLTFEKLFSPCALDALILKMTGPVPTGDGEAVSKLFPLAVGNTLTAALNLAAELGERTVNRAIINRA